MILEVVEMLELQLMKALADEKKADDGSEFIITWGAYAKAMLYAKLVSRIAGGGMECYGYMLKPADSLDDVVTDIYFADDQDEMCAHVYVTPEGVKKAGEAAEKKNCAILGWTHSHGSLPTFHSDWDIRNFRTILHEIAPQTMYRNEIVQSVRKGDALYFDNYKIEGFQSSGRILKQVEREPLAFSMVVNERGEFYLERITKTYDQEKNEFVLNEPTHPRLKLVETKNDLVFDVPDMEWEIYEKVSMRGKHSPEQKAVARTDYKSICTKFCKTVEDYISHRGKHSGVLLNLLASKPEISRVELLRARNVPNTLATNESESVAKYSSENLEQSLARTDLHRLLKKSAKLRRHELEDQCILQMVGSFLRLENKYSGNELQKEKDRLIEFYSDRARIIAECRETAEFATKSLIRYAMEPFVDYNHSLNHQHTGFISRILREMATDEDRTFSAAVRRNATHTKGSGNYVFLYPERMSIFNQLHKDLYYMRIGKIGPNQNSAKFLSQFGAQYMEHPEELDGLVEKYLISPYAKHSEKKAIYGKQTAETKTGPEKRPILEPVKNTLHDEHGSNVNNDNDQIYRNNFSKIMRYVRQGLWW
jgi:proteasome lid subunit RPN8/RPN11